MCYSPPRSQHGEQLLPLLKGKYPETIETIDGEAYKFVFISPTLKESAISFREFRIACIKTCSAI
jgi:hypothetical protein